MKPNRTLLFILLCLLLNIAVSQKLSKIGLFDERTDVGSSAIQGKATYNSETQEYTMEGAGINMWANTDQFNFCGRK